MNERVIDSLPDDRVPELGKTLVLNVWWVDGRKRQRVRFWATPPEGKESEVMEDTYEEYEPGKWRKVPGEPEADYGPAPTRNSGNPG
ncbi:MAG: hypothetical protein HY978_02100 [Candidatus Liptonbacteria bacterium]|nr:hypothetical protein [Candidatus Liptonbacteria bacterium]